MPRARRVRNLAGNVGADAADDDEGEAAVMEMVSTEPFFAPVSRDLLGGLLDQYQAMRRRIEDVASLVESEAGSALDYFLRGNVKNDRRFSSSVSELFDPENAVAALNSDFWRRTLALTDVYECMPQARRDEWDRHIHEMTAPDFTEEAVVPTIQGMLDARESFLAERVDGIFRALSGNHVTNEPQGFGKRMILEYVFSDWGGVQWSRSGTVNDLRCVIARFMGRDEPRTNQSQDDLRRIRKNTGEWHTLDGGALRIRVYLKGTAHLEVHPDMAWRLNAILHQLHPRAIPAAMRVKPAKQLKAFAMLQRPLPFEVIRILSSSTVKNKVVQFSHWDAEKSKPATAEACKVVESIGGVRTESKYAETFAFDYDPESVIDQIVMSGCIPDRVSHQFYPTPERLAREAVAMARVAPGHRCLEPSAGLGGIADLLTSPVCVEISELHCAVLEARGHSVIRADFLQWAQQPRAFDRIVMNPPFSEGRWLAHVQAAARLLERSGRLVAILPSSARGKELVPGMVHEWSQVYPGEFAGTSVEVVMLALEHSP